MRGTFRLPKQLLKLQEYVNGPEPKYWLGFSYIHSEDKYLDMNFHETEMKSKSDHSPKNKVK